MIPVQTDFQDDLRTLLNRKLSADGYTLPVGLSPEEVLRIFFQLEHRKIRRRPRTVVRSAEITLREPSLPTEQRKALHGIEAAVQAGDDLNPYLSRDLASSRAFRKQDGLLNDLGVQHMHLGEGLDGRGLVKGTSELLFVIVTEASVHWIDVFDHKSFTSDGPFVIAEKNWPHLFQHVSLKGVVGLERPVTDQDRAELRKAGINTFSVSASGAVFAPPGGGVVTSGLPRGVISAADRVLDLLDEQSKWCGQHAEELADRVVAAGRTRPTSLRLRLVDLDEQAGTIRIAVDESSVMFNISYAK